MCPAEPALFFYLRDGSILAVTTPTDDFLCAVSSKEFFHGFKRFVEKVVPVTIQEGPLLKYLNIGIIQTEEGISIDQSKHIYDERFKTADTPFRTDSAYEKSLRRNTPSIT